VLEQWRVFCEIFGREGRDEGEEHRCEAPKGVKTEEQKLYSIAHLEKPFSDI